MVRGSEGDGCAQRLGCEGDCNEGALASFIFDLQGKHKAQAALSIAENGAAPRPARSDKKSRSMEWTVLPGKDMS